MRSRHSRSEVPAPRARAVVRRRHAVLGLVTLLAAGATAAPRAVAAEPYVLHADLSYDLGSPVSPAAHNRLDLYVPRRPSLRPRRPLPPRRPVVVYVHGGGWRRRRQGQRVDHKAGCSRARGTSSRASTTASLRPFTACRPPTGSGSPHHPHDVGEALGWLRRNVRRYGGDPGRLVLIGHSAGAHLAALVGVDPSFGAAYGVPARPCGAWSRWTRPRSTSRPRPTRARNSRHPLARLERVRHAPGGGRGSALGERIADRPGGPRRSGVPARHPTAPEPRRRERRDAASAGQPPP